MTAIDLTHQIDDIRERYEDAWRSEEAHRELCELWGGEANPAGVFEEHETVQIGLEGKRQWKAEVHVASTRKGWHAMSTSYSCAIGGSSSSPSVWSRTAYTDKEEALQAGYGKLIEAFEKVKVDRNSCAPKTQLADAQRMIEMIRERMGPQQMGLF